VLGPKKEVTWCCELSHGIPHVNEDIPGCGGGDGRYQGPEVGTSWRGLQLSKEAMAGDRGGRGSL
jgi:hypothetical protein